jgi:NACalpha-BTF3-like transcription factor
MSQTSCCRQCCVRAMIKCNGDIVDAIFDVVKIKSN